MALLLVALFSLLAPSLGQRDVNVECPFPDGQLNVTSTKCSHYSACIFSDGMCYMAGNSEAGYFVASEPMNTSQGFIIYEPANSRYEVPVPLNLPSEIGTSPMYNITVASTGEPFSFNIARNSTGTVIYESFGALSFEDQFIQFTSRLPSSYLYGFGENAHTSFRHSFSPRATSAIFTNDEAPIVNNANLYGAHPYYMVMEDYEGNSHSVLFYNSNSMEYSTFLLNDGSSALTLRTNGGIIDLHFFLGPFPEDLNSQYANTIGTPTFPPYWAFGFHLSRWGYNSTDSVREVRARMKLYGIPQDCQTFDIDYMDGKKDFTYDPVNFVDLPQLIQELHDDNLKVTMIIDPAIATDWENYAPINNGDAVDAFIKWMSADLVPADQEPENKDYIVGYVWPENKTLFPDFMKPEAKDWWKTELETMYQNLSFDALWIDMNEPTNFGTNLENTRNWPGQPAWSLKCPSNTLDAPPYPTLAAIRDDNESQRLSDRSICMSTNQTDGNSTFLHYDVHSLYGYYESIATFEALQSVYPGERPFVLSRSTFVGSGKYAAHWLGDNTASWQHLRQSIIGMLEFNMFGIPMVGADICGFRGEPSEELCARWMQLGAFYPFSRNHNEIGTADQDPAVWPFVAQISKDVLLLRYKYIPYLYTLFHKAHMHGHSVIRPLLNSFPDDLIARDKDDHFMWGDSLMIAPILDEGATSRLVYFPQGMWFDLVEKKAEIIGPAEKVVQAPLEKIPVYLRGGSILPYQKPAVTTADSRKNAFGLTIALDTTEEAYGDLYWDDGVKEYIMPNFYMSKITYIKGILNITNEHSTEPVQGMSLETVEIFGYLSNPSSIEVNEVPLPSSKWTFDDVKYLLTIQLYHLLEEEMSMVIT